MHRFYPKTLVLALEYGDTPYKKAPCGAFLKQYLPEYGYGH